MMYKVYVFVDEIERRVQYKFYLFIVNLSRKICVCRWVGSGIAHKKLPKQLIDELFMSRIDSAFILRGDVDAAVIKYVKQTNVRTSIKLNHTTYNVYGVEA